ncbi:MAG: ribonuclease R [Bacteroides sp.]|jgi:ribonuclease R|nr:ribonuclease R [Bacteroides sp.]
MAKKKDTIKADLREPIVALFSKNRDTLYNYKQVAKALGPLGQENRKFISGVLYALAKENILLEAYKGKFKLNPLYAEKQKKIGPFITGRVDMKQTGKAYIISSELLEDVLIAPNNTGYALHDDKVKVRLFPKRKNHKTEGEIIEILERPNKTWVGILQVGPKFAFLVPDSKTMPVDIFIPLEHLNGARNGQKAIAEITEWAPPSKNPYGKITEVLGEPGDNEVEMHAILAQYGLPARFEKEVEQAAEKIPGIITESEIARREDFRDVITFTIDPFDAKDLDDALSFRKLSENLYEVGVHIADVTHYVKQGTIVDKEAINRATSIYLVDRTIPMLPENLSNNLCSLNPNTDKLCYSVVFNITEKAKVLKYRIVKTIINTDRRFSYEEAQKIIEERQGPLSEAILTLNDLAQIFRSRRMKEGAISFDKEEFKFKLDEKGKPLEVYFKVQKEANKLIEEFMLLANRTVAEHIGKPRGKAKPKTFVYRIHDVPNLEKLSTLSEFVSKLGYKLRIDTRKNISSSFNQLLEDAQGKGEENLIETLAIRSMAKAEYSTQNIGHYGLAFAFYSHFTSPIRRYPDMMAHRLLFDYANGKPSASEEFYEELCVQSSDMEKKAQDAERDSVKLKQVEFMSDKIGQEFDGLISGVSKWGIFVEIKENKVEGMVRLRDLADDYYYLDEDNYQVIGNNKHKVYKLGSPVRVRIKSTDLLKKELDLEMVE